MQMLEEIKGLLGQEQWSEELVRRVEGILYVNAVEGPTNHLTSLALLSQ